MLRDDVLAASTRPEVHAAVAGIYADLQQQIDIRRPVCRTSGRCCRFDEFGHRLYVTTAELALFVYKLEARGERQGVSGAGGCPFQVEGLCSVHAIRPFGCRVFFCDSTASQWQQEQYEHFHARLKRLHEELAVPYFYIEWRQALAELGLAGPSERSGSTGLSLPQLRF